ncbi:MAG: hypothetical protein NTU95_06815 [Methanothrix sp.]|nr:hypothetical protein [Methanothrix sp.]
MKLQAVISGERIEDMDFRLSLLLKATELGCENFFSCIRMADGLPQLIARIEGDEGQISDFKRFVQMHKQDGVDVSVIGFEEYAGHVPSIQTFMSFCIVELLDKWVRGIDHPND